LVRVVAAAAVLFLEVPRRPGKVSEVDLVMQMCHTLRAAVVVRVASEVPATTTASSEEMADQESRRASAAVRAFTVVAAAEVFTEQLARSVSVTEPSRREAADPAVAVQAPP